MYSLDEVRNVDPEIAEAIVAEQNRQNDHIELIASENWVSKAVMAAMGSPLTNKYAEGYPGKRYYGGCECVDVVENLARERAKELFGCDYVNVQPHSGAQANMAVFFAVMQPGDTFMGMNLDHGGHLSHGSPVNMSGKYFHCVPYGVNDEGFIDYDKVREIALECKPKMIVAGASAYVVYRCGNGKWELLTRTKRLYYIDSKAQKGITYRYAVKAYSTVDRKNIYSSKSNTKSGRY